jgi:hypothetical protein
MRVPALAEGSSSGNKPPNLWVIFWEFWAWNEWPNCVIVYLIVSVFETPTWMRSAPADVCGMRALSAGLYDRVGVVEVRVFRASRSGCVQYCRRLIGACTV